MKTTSLLGTNRNQKLVNTLGLSIVILTSLVLSTSLAAAQNPDFSISANPTTLCVNPGIDGTSVITISSLGGFSGTVNLGANISPNYSNGPTLSSIPSSVDLTGGQAIPLSLGVSTTQSTPIYAYTITVAGLSGGLYHSASVSLVVSTDCSVGGVTLPTSGPASTGTSFALGIAIAGLAGIAVAGLVFYVRRSRSNSAPVLKLPTSL
jgi:LPXTG-motif cell wall-anchored protein